MPQLDMSSWLMMILAMFLTLFFIMQLKINKIYIKPESKKQSLFTSSKPWEYKWMKIYLPLSLPLHY